MANRLILMTTRVTKRMKSRKESMLVSKVVATTMLGMMLLLLVLVSKIPRPTAPVRHGVLPLVVLRSTPVGDWTDNNGTWLVLINRY